MPSTGGGTGVARSQDFVWWNQAACLPLPPARFSLPCSSFHTQPYLPAFQGVVRVPRKEKGRQAGFKWTSNLLCEPFELSETPAHLKLQTISLPPGAV